jgi:hypothetical protein
MFGIDCCINYGGGGKPVYWRTVKRRERRATPIDGVALWAGCSSEKLKKDLYPGMLFPLTYAPDVFARCYFLDRS